MVKGQGGTRPPWLRRQMAAWFLFRNKKFDARDLRPDTIEATFQGTLFQMNKTYLAGFTFLAKFVGSYHLLGMAHHRAVAAMPL